MRNNSCRGNFSSPENIIGRTYARQRGHEDYESGVVCGDNPYDENDGRHWAWLEGWVHAGLKEIRKRQRS